jgi:hypothetical protein
MHGAYRAGRHQALEPEAQIGQRSRTRADIGLAAPYDEVELGEQGEEERDGKSNRRPNLRRDGTVEILGGLVELHHGAEPPVRRDEGNVQLVDARAVALAMVDEAPRTACDHGAKRGIVLVTADFGGVGAEQYAARQIVDFDALQPRLANHCGEEASERADIGLAEAALDKRGAGRGHRLCDRA